MTWLIGITQSLFAALGMTITKLVLENKIVGNNLQTLFSRSTHTMILCTLILSSFFSFEIPISEISYIERGLFALGTIGLYFTYYLRRTAYANEKVSVLQPFAMLFQIFPIIFGFIFITSERANTITFLMAILASFIVISSSINLRNFKVNKYSLMVLGSSTIKSVQLFIIIHLLTKLNPVSLYLIESLFIIGVALILMFFKNEYSEFKLISKKYCKLLFTANTIAIVSIILSLTMYSSLGVVATSLISLLYLVFVYIFGYFILKDSPAKKDIIMTILVALCIIIGLFFKN